MEDRGQKGVRSGRGLQEITRCGAGFQPALCRLKSAPQSQRPQRVIVASGKADRTSQITEKRLEVLPLDAPERPGVITLLVWAACVYLLILPIADVLIRIDFP